jgi:hypothetical protein
LRTSKETFRRESTFCTYFLKNAPRSYQTYRENPQNRHNSLNLGAIWTKIPAFYSDFDFKKFPLKEIRI